MEKKIKEKQAELYKRRYELSQKRILKLKNQHKAEMTLWKRAIKNVRENCEVEIEQLENQIGKLNQLIGIMKTGRIRYEATISKPVSENMNWAADDAIKNGSIEKVSGVLFLQEIQQVEVRPDHVLIVTNSGREIALGKAYNYLQDIFSIK